jgi:hypothetical protein
MPAPTLPSGVVFAPVGCPPHRSRSSKSSALCVPLRVVRLVRESGVIDRADDVAPSRVRPRQRWACCRLGNVLFTRNSSVVSIYTTPTDGTALAEFIKPFSGFNGTNLYVEGIAPGNNTLSWSYSEQSDCVDLIRATVVRVSITPSSMDAIESLDSVAFICVVTSSGLILFRFQP